MDDKRTRSSQDEEAETPGGPKGGRRLDGVLADLAAISARLEALEADLERLREAERAAGIRP